jgi:hypothetical protein
LDDVSSEWKGGFCMAYLIGDFKWWLNKKIDKLTCRIYGHQGLILIEEYSRQRRLKILGDGSLKKLSNCSCQLEFLIHGKIKCKTCGCVFIGDVSVKVNDKEEFSS